MCEIQPDTSFVRDGRELPAWLIDLVADTRPIRQSAGEALGGMWRGFPTYSTPMSQVDLSGLDIARQQVRFASEARDAVEAPGFPKAEFVRGLCFLEIALKDEWLETLKRDTLEARLTKAVYANAESSFASGFVSHLIFSALDTAFLTDTDGLWAMLAHDEVRHAAMAALERIGPPAKEFVPYLLDRLERLDDEAYLFGGARALGSIGRGDSEVVDALIAHLRGPKRRFAAQSLRYIGPDLAGREDEVVALLLDASRRVHELFDTVPALASVGRNRTDALERVVERAVARPPRWEPDEYARDGRADMTMWERGVAIDALRYFTAFPDRVVPVLVTAFDDFEEYDSDYMYDGSHVRVCRSLEAFGAEAAPIVSRVIAYIEQWARGPAGLRDTWPKDAMELLVAIGPPARNALPILERIRLEGSGDKEDLDPFFPVDRAILRLRES